MNQETKTFRIYCDGRLDYRATYVPIIKQKALKRLADTGNKIDFFFENNRWPRKDEI